MKDDLFLKPLILENYINGFIIKLILMLLEVKLLPFLQHLNLIPAAYSKY